MEKKQVARFSSTQSALLDQIKNQLENDRVKVFTGSLEDRYQIYLENTPEDPLSFDEWLNR